MFDVTEHPHRRYNPLIGEYVLVSPHRTKRPWQGKQDKLPADDKPQYDEKCYLCPGNTRANGETNPDYSGTYVFTNDFAAVLPDVPEASLSDNPLFQLEGVRGTARVLCFSPRHDLTLPEMDLSTIRNVVDMWAEQTSDLGKTYQWVQIFQNQGANMGASNPHPHGQVWAIDHLPNEIVKENRCQRDYLNNHGSVLLLDYAQQELVKQERVVVANDDWVVIVPFWAVWPYEVLVLPRFHVKRMPDLQDTQRDNLADILKQLHIRYDNLFETSFPYSMGWHGAPFNNDANEHWQLHAHYYPPLLRSATVSKFMVGFEMLAEAQRDITPEYAAQRLRELSSIHYKEQND